MAFYRCQQASNKAYHSSKRIILTQDMQRINKYLSTIIFITPLFISFPFPIHAPTFYSLKFEEMWGDLQEESIRCLISGKERFEVYPGTSPERSMIFIPSLRSKLGSRYSSGGLRTVTRVICSFLPGIKKTSYQHSIFNSSHSLFLPSSPRSFLNPV